MNIHGRITVEERNYGFTEVMKVKQTVVCITTKLY